MKRVLFLNHQKFRCGVQQFGQLVANALKLSSEFVVSYLEVADRSWFETYDFSHDIIVYNYHDQTMTWLDSEITKVVDSWGIKQFCITGHDHFAAFEKTINIVPDPTGVDDEKTKFTGRVIPVCPLDEYIPIDVPVIGSFGFGFYQKSFSKIASLVNEQFDKAIVRLHIPSNDFADVSGHMATMFLQEMSQHLKPGIRFRPSFDFLDADRMVNWLHINDINVFAYDDQPGRGISSAIDFALAAKKPIAISKSSMFRHIYDNEEILISRPLKDIIADGFKPLESYYEQWHPERLAKRYEEILLA